MAGWNILKWLYKHSPVNFYSITDNGETVVKSINNTSVGYKFNYVIEHEKIERLRRVVKRFKRLYTIILILTYFLLIYCVVFPNYDFFFATETKSFLVIPILFIIMFLYSFINSKIYEYYLKKHFGEFEKTHFPSSNSIEHQSYKDFKFELVKIFLLLAFLFGVYLWIGSPTQTALKLIKQERYYDAIKMTTMWTKIIPVDPKWYSLRAYANFKIKNYGNAINDYDKAYRFENDEYKMMNFDNKIFIRYFVKDYKQALDDFDEEINKASNSSAKDAFLWDKAQFLYNIGKYKQSLGIYNELLINSESDEVFLLQNRLYYERALVLKKLGKETEAQQDLEKAQELNLEETFQSPIPEPRLLMENLE